MNQRLYKTGTFQESRVGQTTFSSDGWGHKIQFSIDIMMLLLECNEDMAADTFGRKRGRRRDMSMGMSVSISMGME